MQERLELLAGRENLLRGLHGSTRDGSGSACWITGEPFRKADERALCY
jgi:hypothetical protein